MTFRVPVSQLLEMARGTWAPGPWRADPSVGAILEASRDVDWQNDPMGVPLDIGVSANAMSALEVTVSVIGLMFWASARGHAETAGPAFRFWEDVCEGYQLEVDSHPQLRAFWGYWSRRDRSSRYD